MSTNREEEAISISLVPHPSVREGEIILICSPSDVPRTVRLLEAILIAEKLDRQTEVEAEFDELPTVIEGD